MEILKVFAFLMLQIFRNISNIFFNVYVFRLLQQASDFTNIGDWPTLGTQEVRIITEF